MAFIIDIKVVPSAGKTGWALDKSGTLKCYLKSPPEKGKANIELVKTVAKALGVPQDKVHLIGGLASRSKRLKIDLAMSYDQFLQILGFERQISAF